jgi:lysine 2,3-aminomutase
MNLMKIQILNEETDEPPSKQPPHFSDASANPERPILVLTSPEPSRRGYYQKSQTINKAAAIQPVFPVSKRSTAFRLHFFPDVSESQWNDWRWQVKNRLNDLNRLARVLTLSDEEYLAISQHQGPLPGSITPYYASLIDRENPNQALRRTVLMNPAESIISPGEEVDPLNEDGDSPIPGLVHRYPDRVLFLVTGFCAVYCRYCTRSRMVGNPGGEYRFSIQQWEQAIEYIRQHTEVRDVLLSGGDPLTLADEKLHWLISRLRKIPHLEFIRIGTKVPAVLPQRITPSLLNTLRQFHPLWLSIHFTHPDELTPETIRACENLADAGIPLGSQTVLLKGINDNVDTLKKLFHGLIKCRVKPYYLYQCDPVSGTSHFRTSIQEGLDLIAGLRGHTTGYAVPTYVVDAPGGGGKIALLPDSIIGREGDNLLLKNYEGKIFQYPDPQPQPAEIML